jgi:hypothetical protein
MLLFYTKATPDTEGVAICSYYLNSMKKAFILFFFNLILSNVLFCQNGIDDITLTFSHSLRIPDHYIAIKIRQKREDITVEAKSNPMDRYAEKWKHTKVDTTFKITKIEFEHITQSILQIDGNAIAKSLNFTGLDGTICSIEFGNFQNTVSYSVWSPHYKTEERHLEIFLETFKLILKMGNFDPKKILYR